MLYGAFSSATGAFGMGERNVVYIETVEFQAPVMAQGSVADTPPEHGSRGLGLPSTDEPSHVMGFQF